MRIQIAIIFFSLFAIHSAKELNAEEAKAHFWAIMDKVTKDFIKSDTIDIETNLPCHRYNVPAKGRLDKNDLEYDPHLIDIGFNTNNDIHTLKFFYCKKSDVVKQLAVYDDDQIRIQSKAFPEFIKRMTSVNGKESRKLYFNMIEDIKDNIRDLVKKDTQKLKFEESFDKKNDIVVLNLFFAETLLANFKIVSIQKENNKDFFLVVSFTITEDQTVSTTDIEIPVLTENPDIFKTKMLEITSLLKLANHINCNKHNLEQMAVFAKDEKNFGPQVIFTPRKESTDLIQMFDLTTRDEKAIGRIAYVAPKDKEVVGSYNLQVEMNDSLVVDNNFQRMTNQEYIEWLKTLDIKAIFLTLFEKISVIFRSKIDAGFSKEGSLTHTMGSPASFFSFDKSKTDIVILDNSNLIIMALEEKSEDVLLTCNLMFDSVKKISMLFQRISYSPATVGDFLDNCITVLIKSRTANLSGKIGSRVLSKIINTH